MNHTFALPHTFHQASIHPCLDSRPVQHIYPRSISFFFILAHANCPTLLTQSVILLYVLFTLRLSARQEHNFSRLSPSRQLSPVLHFFQHSALALYNGNSYFCCFNKYSILKRVHIIICTPHLSLSRSFEMVMDLDSLDIRSYARFCHLPRPHVRRVRAYYRHGATSLHAWVNSFSPSRMLL